MTRFLATLIVEAPGTSDRIPPAFREWVAEMNELGLFSVGFQAVTVLADGPPGVAATPGRTTISKLIGRRGRVVEVSRLAMTATVDFGHDVEGTRYWYVTMRPEDRDFLLTGTVEVEISQDGYAVPVETLRIHELSDANTEWYNAQRERKHYRVAGMRGTFERWEAMSLHGLFRLPERVDGVLLWSASVRTEHRGQMVFGTEVAFGTDGYAYPIEPIEVHPMTRGDLGPTQPPRETRVWVGPPYPLPQPNPATVERCRNCENWVEESKHGEWPDCFCTRLSKVTAPNDVCGLFRSPRDVLVGRKGDVLGLTDGENEVEVVFATPWEKRSVWRLPIRPEDRHLMVRGNPITVSDAGIAIPDDDALDPTKGGGE